MSVYDGATRVQDKFGRDVRAFQLATLERDALGVERLGWALVAGRNGADAARRAHILWPGVTVLGSTEAAPM
jgi:hypothetical protein